MSSYYSNRDKLISQLENDYSLINKRNLELFSSRNNSLNNLSSSGIYNQSNFLPNLSTINKNDNYLYNEEPTEIYDFTKLNLEYDIQISALKKKLSNTKEERKETQKKVNLMKIRINKLLNEEKESMKELENIKKSIQKIKTNREKRHKNLVKNKLNFIPYSKNSTIIHNISNISRIYNSSSLIKNKLGNFNSFNVSLRKNKKIKNIQNNGIITNFMKDKNCNKSLKNRNNNLKIKFGTYSVRNTPPYLEKLALNNNSERHLVNNISKDNDDSFNIFSKNAEIEKFTQNNNNSLNEISIKNKKKLKNQIKQNLINKLNNHEKEKKKIEDEIKKIEKEQYNLWINFTENMNSGNTTSNSNNNKSNTNKLKKSGLFIENEDDENIVNYNYNYI